MNLYHRLVCRSARWRRVLENKALPWVLDGLDLGDHLLEVGPGPGLTTDLLRRQVARLTAIEIDPLLVGQLQRRLAGTNACIVEGDATAMAFEPQTFSSAISLTMLHHVPSAALQDRLLAEVFRVLRSGGVFAGMDARWSLGLQLIHWRDTLVPVDPDTFGARLAAVGFTRIAVEKIRQAFRFRAWRG